MSHAAFYWPHFLRQGVGIIADNCQSEKGHSQFPEANRIFAECLVQGEDLPVQAEAYLRKAELALYGGDAIEAEGWLQRGRDRRKTLGDELLPHAHIDCLLLESMILERMGRHQESLVVALQAWDVARAHAALAVSGQIAYRLGALYLRHGAELEDELFADDPLCEARRWFTKSVERIILLKSHTLASINTILAARGKAGILHQRLDGYRSEEARWHFARAQEQLRVMGADVDPEIRTTYWRDRAYTALRCFRPQALWFFLRSLPAAYLSWRGTW